MSAEGVAKAARHGAAAMVIQHMARLSGRRRGAGRGGGHTGRATWWKTPRTASAPRSAGGRWAASRRAACFSFYATKNLPIGEGGAITTTDGDLAERWRRMRLHGMSRDAWRRYHRSGSWRYTVEDAGMKANFTDLQAAIGREQLRRLRDVAAAPGGHRRALRRTARRRPRPRAPAAPGGGHARLAPVHRAVHHRAFGMDRDTVSERLAEAGIGTSVHFIPVHHLPYFRNLLGLEACGELTAADRIFPQLLSLPMYPGLTDSDVDRVCEALAGLAA